MKLFKATTIIQGVREPYVDWINADTGTEVELRETWEGMCLESGVPIAKASFEVVECDPVTLKPLNP